MASDTPFPPLRSGLVIHPGPPARDGSPTATLHDPVRQQFFRLGWAELEMLRRWPLGTATLLADAISRETTLEVDDQLVLEFIGFLRGNELLAAAERPQTAFLISQEARGRKGIIGRALDGYLFLKIPLWHGDKFFQAAAPRLGIFFARWFWAALLVILVLAGWNTLRQLDRFLTTFDHLFNAKGAMVFALVLAAAKACHEFGHALSTARAGCRVGRMGVALIVFWPVLYTDTNDAWRLKSRLQRARIAIAGVAAESILAVLALAVWPFLPEGAARTTAVVVVTSIWITTIAVNLNPLMRFDGYYLLSDLMDCPNLQPRSLALVRWKLGEWLFGFGKPPPEFLPSSTERGLLAYGFLLIAYRLVLYIGIALVVYHAFFKLAGIILFLVEISLFIGRPVWLALRNWWGSRGEMSVKHLTCLGIAAIGLVVIAIVPWSGTVEAPAIQRSVDEATIFPDRPAVVAEVMVKVGQDVSAGQPLLVLHSPEVDHEISRLQQGLKGATRVVDYLATYGRERERYLVEAEKLASLASEVEAMGRVKDKLIVTAPFDGRVTGTDDGLAVGQWYKPSQSLLHVADPSACTIDAYVAEGDVGRIAIGGNGVFQAEGMAEFQPVTVERIDRLAVTTLPTPLLASPHGGEIAARQDQRGRWLPVESYYRVQLSIPTCQHEWVVRGHVVLESERHRIVDGLLKRVRRIGMIELGL